MQNVIMLLSKLMKLLSCERPVNSVNRIGLKAKDVQCDSERKSSVDVDVVFSQIQASERSFEKVVKVPKISGQRFH